MGLPLRIGPSYQGQGPHDDWLLRSLVPAGLADLPPAALRLLPEVRRAIARLEAALGGPDQPAAARALEEVLGLMDKALETAL